MPPSSTRTASPSPSSCRICCSSAARLPAVSAFTVTVNSRPIRRSEPARSFGRIFVPRRFQTSGGTVPTRRRVFVVAGGSGSRSGAKGGSIRGGSGRIGGSGDRDQETVLRRDEGDHQTGRRARDRIIEGPSERRRAGTRGGLHGRPVPDAFGMGPSTRLRAGPSTRPTAGGYFWFADTRFRAARRSGSGTFRSVESFFTSPSLRRCIMFIESATGVLEFFTRLSSTP